MDVQQRTRSCDRQREPEIEKTPKGAKQIVIPMTQQKYDRVWNNPVQVRQTVQQQLQTFPELFPARIEEGFHLAGFLPESKKMPGIKLRQLKLSDGRQYTLRPSFVFGYMTGTVDEVEHPLLLLALGTPCWVVTEIFGHNDMYWQRHLERLGRNSLVGTTVRDAQQLPEDLVADEHHAKWCNEKGYIAFIAGGGCTLGAALTESADEQHLTEAYGVFASECRDLDPEYAPRTVNTDGWAATQKAFRTLFPAVAVILCFLHGFLKIRDRCRKAHDLHTQVWEAYRSATSAEFSKGLAALKAWLAEGTWGAAIIEAVTKLCNRTDEYAVSYAHPNCHRTSNMVDRLMNRLTRFLYAGRGLHGHQGSSERRLRGWALLQNFRPFAPRSNQQRQHQSPAHRLSGKQYHPNWLHNLQTSASMLGCRAHT
jgi:hypothetical protein